MADRRYWTLKQKKEHVAAFRAGGMTVRAYCAQPDTPGTTSLLKWCKLITEGGRARPQPRRQRLVKATLDADYSEVMRRVVPAEEGASSAPGGELAELRAENAKLRRALFALLVGPGPA